MHSPYIGGKYSLQVNRPLNPHIGDNIITSSIGHTQNSKLSDTNGIALPNSTHNLLSIKDSKHDLEEIKI